MKWLLVWWVIHPGHMQAVRVERGFESERACIDRIVAVAPADKPIHWNCYRE